MKGKNAEPRSSTSPLQWTLGAILAIVIGAAVFMVLMFPTILFPGPSHPSDATLYLHVWSPQPHQAPTNVTQAMFATLPGSFQQAMNDTLAANGSITRKIPWGDYERAFDLTDGWANDQGTQYFLLQLPSDRVVSWGVNGGA